MKAETIIKETKKGILEQIKDKLENIDKPTEIYFHDIVTEEIDSNTPTDRQICLSLIDLADTGSFDGGLIDNSSIDRTLITSAYCSIEQVLFNDDFIQELQDNLNNETIDKKKAEEILNKINKVLKEEFKTIFPKIKDTATQVFIKTSFSINSLTKEDFIKYGLIDKQVIDLSDSIKILTSNKAINKNAIVITEKKRDVEKKIYEFRVYLMEKDKGIDIRNFLKLQTISAETGFNLSPSAYIEQTTEQYEEEKKFNKKSYLSEFKDKTLFIKTLVTMTNKLTEISINDLPKIPFSKVVSIEKLI